MIQLLDRIIDEKENEVMIVKMDVITYNNIIKEKKDITIELHKMEEEILSSKWYDNVDDLFDDLEK